MTSLGDIKNDLDENIVVQGKTLKEWEHEGFLNESRMPHVHPQFEEDQELTDADRVAAFNSFTLAEAAAMAMASLPPGLADLLATIFDQN